MTEKKKPTLVGLLVGLIIGLAIGFFVTITFNSDPNATKVGIGLIVACGIGIGVVWVFRDKI